MGHTEMSSKLDLAQTCLELKRNLKIYFCRQFILFIIIVIIKSQTNKYTSLYKKLNLIFAE